MSVHGVAETELTGNVRNEATLRIEVDSAFSDKVRIGEILQGKVVRHFDGTRYAVNFGGTEKIVDSALPLTRGELIYGRVVGLTDKVHLQRIFPQKNVGVVEPSTTPPRSGIQAVLEDLFAQYHVKLSPSLQAQVLAAMKAHPLPRLVAISYLILLKLGVKTEPLLVRALSKALAGGRREEAVDKLLSMPALGIDAKAEMKNDPILIEELASRLALVSELQQRYLDATPADEQEATTDDADSSNIGLDTRQSGVGRKRRHRDSEEHLGRWLLNVQNAGSVSHRLARLPIWFGDQLVEVDVALFSQRESTVKPRSVRHRKIVLSLQIAGLGQVEVSVYAADRRLRLIFTTESEQVNNKLAAHYNDIRFAVDSLDWIIDDVQYIVQIESSEGVIRNVVEHHIARDSLSRVM